MTKTNGNGNSVEMIKEGASLLALIAAACYFSGFLIVRIYLSRYHVNLINILQARYLSVGFLFLFIDLVVRVFRKNEIDKFFMNIYNKSTRIVQIKDIPVTVTKSDKKDEKGKNGEWTIYTTDDPINFNGYTKVKIIAKVNPKSSEEPKSKLEIWTSDGRHETIPDGTIPDETIPGSNTIIGIKSE